VQSEDRVLNMVQDNISKVLNPVLKNPILDGQILTKISLVVGLNVIPHGLGRTLVGWYFVRVRFGTYQQNYVWNGVYDLQDSNPTPQLNLQLMSVAPVVVDIAVF